MRAGRKSARLAFAGFEAPDIEQTLRERAESIAREEMGAVVHTMRLEDQEVDSLASGEEQQKLVTSLMQPPRKLWR